MKLLLDTHIVEWSLNGDPKLSQQTAELIRAPGNEVVLSVVVLWEIAIKRNLSRRGPNGFSHSAEETHDLMLKSGALILPVTPAHAFAVEALPPCIAIPSTGFWWRRPSLSRCASSPMIRSSPPIATR
jgi:PIN domain nuclease of toxin-antitoxin system